MHAIICLYLNVSPVVASDFLDEPRIYQAGDDGSNDPRVQEGDVGDPENGEYERAHEDGKVSVPGLATIRLASAVSEAGNFVEIDIWDSFVSPADDPVGEVGKSLANLVFEYLAVGGCGARRGIEALVERHFLCHFIHR